MFYQSSLIEIYFENNFSSSFFLKEENWLDQPSQRRQSSATPQDGVFMSAQQLLDLVKNAQAAGPNSEPTHPRSGFARLCRDYTDLGGRPFKGSESVIEIQAWLKSCDRIFSRMNLIDLHRVQVASSMLQERALDWYELLISEINEAGLT